MKQQTSYFQLYRQNLEILRKDDQNQNDQQIDVQAREICAIQRTQSDKNNTFQQKDPEPQQQIQPKTLCKQPKGSQMRKFEQNYKFHKDPEQRTILSTKENFKKIPAFIQNNISYMQTERRYQLNPSPKQLQELLQIQKKLIAQQDLQLQNFSHKINNQEQQIQFQQNQIIDLQQKNEYLAKIQRIFIDDISDYYVMEDKEKIGQGGFAEVYKVRERGGDLFRALKILNKEKLFLGNERDLILTEIQALRLLDHPNIIKLIDIFEDNINLILVMEYCGGVLESNYEEVEIRIIMRQVIDAIQYCHSQGIVHKDIKPSNIMLKNKYDIYSVKLIDFGLSQFNDKNNYFNDRSGTKSFISPEIIIGQYTILCDIWSFAITLYYLMTGINPFKSNESEKSQTTIKILKMQLPPKQLEQTKQIISYEALDLIQKCLVQERKRLTADQVIQHPFFSKYKIY